MTLNLFVLALSIFSISIFLFKRGTDANLGDVFRKCIASLSVVLIALSALRFNSDGISAYITAGLVFGMLGDIFLDLKYAYKQDEKNFLYAGIFAFSLGHLCYGWGIAKDGNLFSLIPILIVCAFFIITLILTVVIEERTKLDYGDYRPLIVLYSSVISIPLTASIMTLLLNPSEASALRAVAMIGFFISDLILSFIYFKEGSTNKGKVLLNHLFYYLAQLCFAISLYV